MKKIKRMSERLHLTNKNEELFSDRNVFPRSCIIKMEKISENKTLTKNMPNVKWNAIPPVRGPNPQGG